MVCETLLVVQRVLDLEALRTPRPFLGYRQKLSTLLSSSCVFRAACRSILFAVGGSIRHHRIASAAEREIRIGIRLN